MDSGKAWSVCPDHRHHLSTSRVSSASSRRGAVKEWIAVAPLWPCRMQDPPPDLDYHHSSLEIGAGVPDDEPDLDWFNRSRNPSNPDPDGFDQRQTWKPNEIHLEDGRILVFD